MEEQHAKRTGSRLRLAGGGKVEVGALGRLLQKQSQPRKGELETDTGVKDEAPIAGVIVPFPLARTNTAWTGYPGSEREAHAGPAMSTRKPAIESVARTREATPPLNVSEL